ncbi:MAG: site-2 protease family protein, partial [Clostridia bacterium]|nr:site-2 protease family protein [Clostridia bacterium]
PIPPLDGSRILFAFLPTNAYFAVMKYERYIMIGMMILLWSGIVDLPLSGAIDSLYSLGYNLFYLFPAA